MTMLMSALAYSEEGARHEASARRCESESTPREAWRRQLAGATPHRGRDRAGWVWRTRRVQRELTGEEGARLAELSEALRLGEERHRARGEG